jgi:hypothetical protein
MDCLAANRNGTAKGNKIFDIAGFFIYRNDQSFKYFFRLKHTLYLKPASLHMSKAKIEEKSMTSSQTDFKKRSVKEIAQSPQLRENPQWGATCHFLSVIRPELITTSIRQRRV